MFVQAGAHTALCGSATASGHFDIMAIWFFI